VFIHTPRPTLAPINRIAQGRKGVPRKWFKNEVVEDINVISEYFGYSYTKAKQVQNLITSDQLKIMRQKLEKGGLKSKEKKNGGEH
jgi:hypothetical protein